MYKKLTILLIILCYCPGIYPANITIIGCGYVGLTCTAILARVNHTIRCIDTDHTKINLLQTKQVPFYEPGLDELLFDPTFEQHITYTTTFDSSICQDIYYLCVPTPMGNDGYCDCSYLYTAFHTLLDAINHTRNITVCVKSTIPPGTMRTLTKKIHDTGHTNVQLIYNPEFMREGSALSDIYTRNPIVIGSESVQASDIIEQLLSNALPTVSQIIKTNFETAELIKYAWNAFSAIRIAYINELALICRDIGGDISVIARALSLSEQLLQTKDLKPGPGYGGSCLPKDTKAFAQILVKHNLYSTLVHRAIESNDHHKQRILNDITNLISPTKKSQIVSLLGLSFKANTTDIRNALALDIIPLLLDTNVTIKAYDPKAMPSMQRMFPTVTYCHNPYQAIEDSDAIIILTEWEEFKTIDLSRVAELCNKKRIFDTRNLFNRSLTQELGFEYITLGSV